MEETNPTFWQEFGSVSEAAFLNIWDNTLYIVAATGIGYLIFVWLRNRPSVQERILPLLDDVRGAIIRALNQYMDFKETPATVVAAAIIGASILCSFTLLAFALIISNFGTPVG